MSNMTDRDRAMLEALNEARLQLAYLHELAPKGSTNVVLRDISEVIDLATGDNP